MQKLLWLLGNLFLFSFPQFLVPVFNPLYPALTPPTSATGYLNVQSPTIHHSLVEFQSIL